MYEGKNVFVLGLAKSGYAAARFLLKRGAHVLVNDMHASMDSDEVKELIALGATCVMGHHPVDLFDDSFDMLVKNPGVPLEHVYVRKAHEYQIPVLNELEIGFRELPSVNLIAITGTNGKTTTTTLIYEFLKAWGKRVFLVGNIGNPLCNVVDEVLEGDFVVCEIAALQLIDTPTFKANVAVFTNITEDHIDFFKTYERYKNAKKILFENQSLGDIAILNGDQPELLELLSDIPSTKRYFTKKNPSLDAYCDGEIIDVGETIKTEDILLLGMHNYENIMAAILAVKEYGIPFSVISSVLAQFRGVEHRIEYVGEADGVTFYNDSKATNIDSTIVSLEAIKQSTVLLLGGLDRGQDFYRLGKHMNYVKAIITYGETKERIEAFAKTMLIECVVVNNLSEAVDEAFLHAGNGDAVLLSPACASWDQFKNFEVRGQLFKELVLEKIKA